MSSQSLLGALLTGVTLLATEVVEEIGGFVGEWGRDLIIGGAMLIAWRILRSAESNAVLRYKLTADEADETLAEERIRWERERVSMAAKIRELREEVDRLRDEVRELLARQE